MISEGRVSAHNHGRALFFLQITSASPIADILQRMESHLLLFTKALMQYAARGVEFAAALVIVLAALQATGKAFLLFFRSEVTPQQKNEVRLTMARWLALALEFELAADILNTAVTPTWSDITKLAAIAAIRTALNYFLEREIDAESRPEQRMAEESAVGPTASVTAVT